MTSTPWTYATGDVRVSTDGAGDGRSARSSHEDDVQTIPELGAEVRGLRDELRAYVQRHDREHERLGKDHRQHLAELNVAIAANTEFRMQRQAYEHLVRWLVGSNVGVLIGLCITVAAILGAVGASG
jgi:hypothetical protein